MENGLSEKERLCLLVWHLVNATYLSDHTVVKFRKIPFLFLLLMMSNLHGCCLNHQTYIDCKGRDVTRMFSVLFLKGCLC